MTDISILPEFDGRYFGQKRILEHLSLLIHWAEKNNEPLPPLLFTGAHGQGQKVLAALISEHLAIPLYDLYLFQVSSQLMCKLIANGEVKRFNSLSDVFKVISSKGMLFLEPEPAISGYELDQVVELWNSCEGTSDDAIYSLSNLIIRATVFTDVPILLRKRIAAHFHFGPCLS